MEEKDENEELMGKDESEENKEKNDEALENPQEVLKECLEKFSTPDFIMESGVYTQFKKYFQAGGSPEIVLDMLTKNYEGVAETANLMAKWLVLAGVKLDEVHAIIENHVQDMILQTFDPEKADSIFEKENKTPDWLIEVIKYPICRSLIYRLSGKYPDCLMLNLAIKLIYDAGYGSEITAAPAVAQQIELFSQLLKTTISNYLNNPKDIQGAIQDCAQMVCHEQYTYAYSQVLIQILSQQPIGGLYMKRLSQEITKYALMNNKDVTQINMALNGSAEYPAVCQALTSMLSRNALNACDITILFRNYSAPDPPPVDIIRDSQFLELLVDKLFTTGTKINPEHKSKYIYLLAYAVSVVDIPCKKGAQTQRTLNKDELKSTVQAIEKAHTICNVNKDANEALLAELQSLFDCIKFPVIGVGVIHWIENIVVQPSYFKPSTNDCPLHLAILDEVASVHSHLHNKILNLLIRLFESKLDGFEVLGDLEMKKMLIDRMMNLLSCGCVIPVVKYMKQCYQKGDTDLSLIRYFVMEVLETITHPYSAEFVHLFLPMVENEEITGAMRSQGAQDYVSEFLVYCKTNYKMV